VRLGNSVTVPYDRWSVGRGRRLPIIFEKFREMGPTPTTPWGQELLPHGPGPITTLPRSEASWREVLSRAYAAHCRVRGIEAMSRTACVPHRTVKWTGEHWGHLALGNGARDEVSRHHPMPKDT